MKSLATACYRKYDVVMDIRSCLICLPIYLSIHPSILSLSLPLSLCFFSPSLGGVEVMSYFVPQTGTHYVVQSQQSSSWQFTLPNVNVHKPEVMTLRM